MLRFGLLVLALASVAAPAVGQNVLHGEAWRLQEVTVPDDDAQRPAIQIGPNARFGPGIFGLKSQTPRRKAVIANEVNAPKQRRAGIGFSFKF